MTLGTSDRLGFPIDAEVGEVIASIRLVPIILEGGADQIHLITSLALYEIGRIDISCIDQVLIWKKVSLSQARVDRCERLLIGDASTRGFDVGDQLRSLLVAGLGEMNFVANPQGSPFLTITGIQIIGRVDHLSCRKGQLLSKFSTLIKQVKLLLPDAAQRHDSREAFHPVCRAGSIQRVEKDPAVSSHLIGILLTLFLLLR